MSEERLKELERYFLFINSTLPFRRLAIWRKELKLTQKKFGKSINLKNSTISDYETGMRVKYPSIKIFNKWYFALKHYEEFLKSKKEINPIVDYFLNEIKKRKK